MTLFWALAGQKSRIRGKKTPIFLKFVQKYWTKKINGRRMGLLEVLKNHFSFFHTKAHGT